MQRNFKMFNEIQNKIFKEMKFRKIPLVIKTSYENGIAKNYTFFKPNMKKSGPSFFIEGKIVKTKFAVLAYQNDMVNLVS